VLGAPPYWCPLPGEIWMFHKELGGDIFHVIKLGPYTSRTSYDSQPTSWDDVDQAYVEAIGADGNPIRFWTSDEVVLPDGEGVIFRISPIPVNIAPPA
jgi:hypothetical protein